MPPSQDVNAFPSAEPITNIAIIHLLAERGPFIDAIASFGDLAGPLPKPNSVCTEPLTVLAPG